MSRKKAATLEQQRQDIRRRYKRGPRAEKRIASDESLSEVERAVKQETAAFLKAAGFSHGYIGEALGMSRGAVRKWFEDGELQKRVITIQTDFLDGAVKLLRTYAIELVEILVNVARTAEDPKIVIQAATEALDRMGLAKVNKSESAASITERREVDITDKSGLVEALKDAPPDVQQRAAEHMEELFALTAEHTERDVTHA